MLFEETMVSNGQLDKENYSTRYLEDRAAFLYSSMHRDDNHPLTWLKKAA